MICAMKSIQVSWHVYGGQRVTWELVLGDQAQVIRLVQSVLLSEAPSCLVYEGTIALTCIWFVPVPPSVYGFLFLG